MTQQHPIIPPPELIDQWHSSLKGDCCPVEFASASIASIAIRAAQWGADQELEACCEWINSFPNKFVHAHDLRLVRRPKPPSLKEQALEELEQLRGDANSMGMGFDAPAIRRALEQLPDHE
jgi:hypothetical protein